MSTNNAQNIQENNFHETSDFQESKKISFNGKGARIHYNPSEAPNYNDEQETLVLSPSNHTKIEAKRSFGFRMAQSFGAVASILWGAICFLYLLLEGGIATQTPYELGIFVAGTLAPVAFYWMLLSYLQRNSDVQYYAESLRAELHSLFFPSEEDSKLVNKDIERMTQQAAELAASSKSALKAIQKTRYGLREEIKEFVSFSRKVEAHIISLSDSLAERSKNMSDIVSTIEDRVQIISEKSDASITSWDNASAKMIERAGDIEMTMEKGANRILSMANLAHDKSTAIGEVFDGTITSLGLTVDAVIDRLGHINDQFGTYTRTLHISTEELSKESGRMSAMIEDHLDQIQNAAGRSVETISHALIDVSEQRDLLEESANILSSKATIISTAITNSVSELTRTADEIVGRAEMTGVKLSEKTHNIAKTLDGLEDQISRIDNASELASHRISEGIDTAMNGSIQISDALRRGVELLKHTAKDTTAESTSMIEATISHVQQLKETGQGNVQSIEAMVELLEKTRLQMEKAAIVSQSHVETLASSVESQGEKLNNSASYLAEQVKLVTRSLDEPLRQVSIAIADADGRHEQIQETLTRRVADLNDASDNAAKTVELIRNGLREQTNEIASLSGRVLSQSKALNTELSENKVQLTGIIDMTLSDMNRLMSDLSTNTQGISKISSDTIGNIENIINIMDVNTNRLIDASDFSVVALEKAKQQLNETANNLEQNIEAAETKVIDANLKLIGSSEKLIPLYQKVEIDSQKAVENLRSIKDSYIDTTETALEKLNTSGVYFDTRLQKLEKGARDATDLLKSSSDMLKQKMDDVEFTTTRAHDKIHDLTKAMESQSAEVNILSEQAILKIESVQKTINNQFVELSETVTLAVSQIEAAKETFSDNAEKISFSADIVLHKFTVAGNEAQAKAYELKQASQNIAETAQNSVTSISAQMQLLNSNSDGALSNLRKTSDTIAIKSKEIDTMMVSVLNQAKNYAGDMREQVRAIADASDKSVTHISQSISAVLGTMDTMHHKTKDIVDYISQTNQSLYDQSGRFLTAVSKSVLATEQATEVFSQQTDNLLKASRYAIEKAEDIRNTELRVGRESFLSSARFVLESLHSLSIDFVRILDGDVAEKDWKSYQKGDVGLFTTKLVTRLDTMPSDKIREKYESDNEFRNYVQKFMLQFEDILDQTDSIDKGALLSATFTGSDIGKVYRYLCNVMGKERKTLLAAA